MSAVEKINSEMQKTPDDKFAEIIGQYLIDRCLSAEDEEKIGAEGKTLKDALSAVKREAEKKKSGNVAVLTPMQVFDAVDKYFGLSTDFEAQAKALAVLETPPKSSYAAKGLAVKLDDFI